MRVALAVNQVSSDLETNLRQIERLAGRAAQAGAKLVLFAETAVTGLINNDDPEHDLPLGQPIPGPLTEQLAAMAAANQIYLGIGLFEREGDCLYDTAILLDASGAIVLRYRRISRGWHNPRIQSIYRAGEDVELVETPLGKFAFLICGDLFDDGLVQRVRQLQPDYLLFPFARNFDDGSWDQGRWDREEQAEYADRARLAGVTTLMVNYLSDPSGDPDGTFGGAFIVNRRGEVLARMPLGRTGLLVADV
ncbi:MAG: carbon-nitrogen hydrolase family protein [Bacillota bacterium]|jgi:predicted amidohydrolase